ncbi:MAG: DUF1573 domain-containing protein [Bacteroidia bacterium]|nr:DUF1573 domain-containing protein [Bacteroidia bacterium]
MKKLIILLLCTSIFSCSNKKNIQQSSQQRELADLAFKIKFYDFGNVSNDTILFAKYFFKNIGKNNLIINYVDPDCTCTGYSLSNDTISPGDSAFIELKFKTENKFGKQKIYTTVCANTETKMYSLILKANVIENN